MDHLDGFAPLLDTFTVSNFWDSGVRKEKPDFGLYSPYEEEDWDRYEAVVTGEDESLKEALRTVGTKFKYANENAVGESGGDGLYILAPDPESITTDGDINDQSYIILYRSPG